MPGQDRTGPGGQGPMTGRGMGLCTRALGRGIGRGFRQGFGFRRGFGNRFVYTDDEIVLSKEDEKKILESELAELEREKVEIEKRLKEKK